MRMFSKKISFKTFLETNYGIGYLQIFLENTFNNPYPLFLFLHSYSVFLSWIPNPIFISCMHIAYPMFPLLYSLSCILYPVFLSYIPFTVFPLLYSLSCTLYPVFLSNIYPLLYFLSYSLIMYSPYPVFCFQKKYITWY